MQEDRYNNNNNNNNIKSISEDEDGDIEYYEKIIEEKVSRFTVTILKIVKKNVKH